MHSYIHSDIIIQCMLLVKWTDRNLKKRKKNKMIIRWAQGTANFPIYFHKFSHTVPRTSYRLKMWIFCSFSGGSKNRIRCSLTFHNLLMKTKRTNIGLCVMASIRKARFLLLSKPCACQYIQNTHTLTIIMLCSLVSNHATIVIFIWKNVFILAKKRCQYYLLSSRKRQFFLFTVSLPMCLPIPKKNVFTIMIKNCDKQHNIKYAFYS